MTTNISNILWTIGPFWDTKSTKAHHYVIIIIWLSIDLSSGPWIMGINLFSIWNEFIEVFDV